MRLKLVSMNVVRDSRGFITGLKIISEDNSYFIERSYLDMVNKLLVDLELYEDNNPIFDLMSKIK